jgi:hypothetical protein
MGMLQKQRAAALLGLIAVLAAEGIGAGRTPDSSKPEPVHSSSRRPSEAVDNTGKVYVADAGNDSIRMISPEGAVTTLTVKQGRH